MPVNFANVNCNVRHNVVSHDFLSRVPFDKVDEENVPTLNIGSNNVFEAGCTVEACEIGDNNVFESKCFVGPKVTITSGCVVGAGCCLTGEEVIPPNTIVYGQKCLRREAMDSPAVSLLTFLWFRLIK